MRPLITILLSLVTALGWGQNLVKNPSFETYIECPDALGTFNKHVKHWSTPTLGSTDYFNTCSKVMGAPENFNGIQHPKFGEAYAGVYFYAPGDYREYVQVPLSNTLRKGENYDLKFYVSLAEGSDFAVKDFGVVFSYKPLAVQTKKNLSRGRLFQMKGNQFQTFEVGHSKFHEDKSIWLKIEISFKARGFENYLILGNLRDNKSTKKVQTKRKESKKGAYYYIDMVTLTSPNAIVAREAIKTDSVYMLKNIHFDFDVFQFDESARVELHKIKEQLELNSKLALEIYGHTDNMGSDAYNQVLSKKRAKSICDYFVDSGIESSRITWFGHGSKKPVADNSTEQGRAQNRRVEFLLKQN